MADDQPSRPAPLDERRASDIPATREDIVRIQSQLSTGDLRMGSMEKELRMNTELTADIRAFLETARAGLRVLGLLGTAAQWAAKIAAAVAALYTAYQLLRHGGPPPK